MQNVAQGVGGKLIHGPCLQLCRDVKTCPGMQRAGQVVGNASEHLSFSSVSAKGPCLGVSAGEGSNTAGQNSLCGEGLEGMSALLRTSFCLSVCKFGFST